MLYVIEAIIIIVVCALVSFIAFSNYKKNVETTIGNAQDKAREIIDEALKTAETKKREALLEAKDEIHKNRNEFENVTYELDDFDELRHSEVRDIKDMLTDQYESIDENDISDKMYETTVTLEYEYDGEEIEEESDIVAVKINGRWYAVSPYGTFLSFVF